MGLVLDSLSITNGQAVNVTAWTLSVPAGSEPVLSTRVRNVMADAAADEIDVSTPGHVKVYTAGFATLLVEFDAAATAFGAASGGTATASGTPLAGTAVATGTAAVYEVTDGADAQLWTGTCSAA